MPGIKGVKAYNAKYDSFNTETNTGIDEAAGGAQGAAVADLNQDISAAYTEAEVQAISDKVDELLGVLRAAGIIAT